MAVKPKLYVEGTDDVYSIIHLLGRHGVDVDNRPIECFPTGSDERLLESMSDAIRLATDYPVGFVLDIDVRIEDRWRSVASRLRKLGLVAPTHCPADGYLGRLANYSHSFGVWLMPDCVADHGKLENLLRSLVPMGDRLWARAEQCTAAAKDDGAMFSEPNRLKAIMHCWLAWQEVPGCPFGTAIKACYFNHDSSEALRFLRWMRNLFGLTALLVE